MYIAHGDLPVFQRGYPTYLDADSVGNKLDIQKLLKKKPAVPATASEQTLNCAHCAHVITAPGERIEIGGQHAHNFNNPHGIEYRIGCFASACGTTGQGPLTGLWSWFAGYQWQISLCRQCHRHLGWRFANGEDFYGLILNRLVEIENNSRSS